MIIGSARANEYFNKMQESGFIQVIRNLDENQVAETQMYILKVKNGKLHRLIGYHIFTRMIDYIFVHNLYERLGI